MSGKTRNTARIPMSSQNSKRYWGRKAQIFLNYYLFTFKNDTQPLYKLLGKKTTIHARLALRHSQTRTGQDRAHHSCSQFRTVTREHHQNQLPLAQQTLPSSLLHTLFSNTRRSELQNTPSWAWCHVFCIFSLHWLLSYTINSPGGY